ncbi:MAG TPA: glycosyltransferase family 87 protein [Pirellulales bacterium]|jgi:hypothetical protein|nr:glycosyltransferase family 87 protein [Pirellulales bacterium]
MPPAAAPSDTSSSLDPASPPARYLPKSTRTTICIALAAFFVGWGLTDIRNRGRYDPARPLNHMTDLTVYTVAGAAFFDGRDPYLVSNPRGWHYLYPPLLAIVLSPLAKLDSQWQVVIWYFCNLVFAWGCCYESLRFLRLLKPAVPPMAATFGTSGAPQPVWGSAPPWLVASAGAAMLWPALNCLHRGQVGLLVTYLVLLGARLGLGSRSWRGWAAGGCALALAVTVKLTPIMPALFLSAMLALPVVMGWNRRLLAPAAGLVGGIAAGLALFLLLLPAAAVGWSANLQHLHRFVDLVVLNQDVGGGNDLTYHSVRNQSLVNAMYRLGNLVAYECGKGPSDLAEPEEQGPSMPMDSRFAHDALLAMRLGLLGLLTAIGWRAARRGMPLDIAAAFGASCVATLLISPLSWAHHYLIAAPGLLAVPLWFAWSGRDRFAKNLAYSAVGLIWAHYLLLDWTGRIGLLGIGTGVWFIAAAVGMLWSKKAKAGEIAKADESGGADPSPDLRAA